MSAHWTHKITFKTDANYWVAVRDGQVVGRVIMDDEQSSCLVRNQWAWWVIMMPWKNGYSDPMLEELKKVQTRASDKLGHKPYDWPDGRSKRGAGGAQHSRPVPDTSA